MKNIIFILIISLGSSSCSGEEYKLYTVSVSNKYGFINGKGTIIIKPQYEEVQEFSEGLAPVKLNGFWGYIDTNGAEKIKSVYKWASQFKESRASVVTQDDISTFINHDGDILFPQGFEYLQDFQEGFAPVNSHGKWGFIDKNGKLVIDYKYDESIFTGAGPPEEVMQFQPYGFLEERVPVRLNKKFGFIDTKGKAITDFIFDFVDYFHFGLAGVYSGEKAGIINKNGKYVLPLEYDEIGIITNSLISVSKNGKYGYIDHSGKIVIPLQFDAAESFLAGRGKIGRKDFKGNLKFGYIDSSGNQIVKPIYDNGYTFDSKGYAIVEIGNKSGVIDTNGKYAIPLIPDIKFESHEGYKFGDAKKLYYHDYISDGTITYKNVKTGKYGFMKIDGKRITNPIFSYAEPFQDSIAKVYISDKISADKFGYIALDGKYIWKPLR